MSSQPDKPPDFNFDIGNDQYDERRLAEGVFWPVLNDFSRRDWREECKLGQPFIFPAHGFQNGSPVDVRLHASCEDVIVDDDEEIKIIRAGLHVIEAVPREMTVRIMDEAQGDDNTAALIAKLIEEGETLTAYSVKSFNFDGNTPLTINLKHIINNPQQEVAWVSDDRYDQTGFDDFTPAPSLDDVEMDAFELGLRILDVPAAIMDIVAQIRQHPIS